VNSRQVIGRLTDDGWILDRSVGSHHQYVKGGRRVTVPHPRRDFPIGTLRNIFRQAGWDWRDR
jgi:predicted RNA binding protein YcfA (HicA-like mRNA interferase family)